MRGRNDGREAVPEAGRAEASDGVDRGVEVTGRHPPALLLPLLLLLLLLLKSHI